LGKDKEDQIEVTLLREAQ